MDNYGILSLAPALIAVILAFITREALFSILCGVLVGLLITGQDLLAQLEGLDLGSELLIPANMLRHEQDRFLDDLTLEQVQGTLGVPVLPVENDAFELLARMLGSR